MTDEMRTAESRSALIADLLDRLTARAQAGEVLDPDALAAEYPELADEVRRLAPGIGLLAGLSRSRQSLGVALSGEAVVGELGDYRIVREVGHGGMGVVYEAEQISLPRRVALKVLPFAAVMDPRHLQRFRNEARAAASLDHPHVVKVYGVGCERGVHFIAMQFIDGRTLSDLIRERRGKPPTAPASPAVGGQDTTGTYAADATSDGPAAVAAGGGDTRTPMDAAYARRVAEWGIQAGEALEHAHTLGIVHRDVKPGNLLVDRRGEVYVADFGLAKVATDPGVTGTGDVLGTLRYMSPEQAGAQHDLVDHRSDIYSLGVTLYELLTLAPAFEGTDRQAILSKVTGTDPVAPRKLDRRIPRDLETVVLKAMDKDPSRRYRSAKELAEDLRRFLNREPVRARRMTLIGRASKWARRQPVLVAAYALTGLAIILGAAAGLTLSMWQKAEAARGELAGQKGEADHARRLAEDATHDARLARDDLARESYFRTIGMAGAEWETNHAHRAKDLLVTCRDNLRGLEWVFLDRVINAELRAFGNSGELLGGAAMSPDGAAVLTSTAKECREWDVATGKERSFLFTGKAIAIKSIGYSQDGKHLMVGEYSVVTILDRATQRPVSVINNPDRMQSFMRASLSPGADMVLTIGNLARVWDRATATEIATIRLPAGSASGGCFSPKQDSLLVWGGWSLIEWDLVNRVERGAAPREAPA